MNVCYLCFDPTAVVSLASLLQIESKHGHPEVNLYLFIDHSRFTLSDEAALHQEVSSYGASIHELDCRPVFSFCESKGLWKFGTYLTYCRIFLPQMCPDLDRILYLDSDTLVLRPLDSLWALNLGGKYLAAVRDPGYSLSSIGTDPNKGNPAWINAGVMLLDLKKLREAKFSEAVSTISRSESLLMAEQGFLNTHFSAHFYYLSPAFNSQYQLKFLSYSEYKNTHFVFDDFSKAHFREAQHCPYIEHFNYYVFNRPWYRSNWSKYSHKWRALYRHCYHHRPSLETISGDNCLRRIHRAFRIVLSRVLPGPWFYHIVFPK